MITFVGSGQLTRFGQLAHQSGSRDLERVLLARNQYHALYGSHRRCIRSRTAGDTLRALILINQILESMVAPGRYL